MSFNTDLVEVSFDCSHSEDRFSSNGNVGHKVSWYFATVVVRELGKESQASFLSEYKIIVFLGGVDQGCHEEHRQLGSN